MLDIVDTLAPPPPARPGPAQEYEPTHPAGNTAASTPPAKLPGWREIAVPSPPQYRWQAQILAGRSLDRVKEDSQKFMRELFIATPRLDARHHANPLWRCSR